MSHVAKKRKIEGDRPLLPAMSLKDEVVFALTTQSGESEPAINADGSSINTFAYYEHKTPITWHDDIKTLIIEHETRATSSTQYAKHTSGISSLAFHMWVENKVKTCDRTYSIRYLQYYGTYLAAYASMCGLNEWVQSSTPSNEILLKKSYSF